MKHLLYLALCTLLLLCFTGSFVSAQSSGTACGGPPNYCANSTRNLVPETRMTAPPVNVPFQDPDFHSWMVRVTNAGTMAGSSYWGNYLVGISYHTDSSGEQNEWSVFDPSIGTHGGYRFWVDGTGGFAIPFELDATTLRVTRLTGKPGTHLGLTGTLPISGSFSYVNPNVLYGISGTLLEKYNFATGAITPLYNFAACPGLLSSIGESRLWYGGLTISGNDSRFSYPLGGQQQNRGTVVAVYDRNANGGAGACYWYDTESEVAGGTNMQTSHVREKAGTEALLSTGYTIHDSRMNKGGNIVRVQSPSDIEYFWVPGTTTVTPCVRGPSSNENVAGYCGGHEAMGYTQVINPTGYFDDLGIVSHPLSSLNNWTLLVSPPPKNPEWGQSSHWSFSDASPSVAMPVCGSTYVDATVAGGDGTLNVLTNPLLQIFGAWDREIVCVATSGPSRVWRFAHDRATGAPNANAAVASGFWSIPVGNVSSDGKFYLFGTDWEWSLGSQQDSSGCPASGTCRTDVFIVKLQ